MLLVNGLFALFPKIVSVPEIPFLSHFSKTGLRIVTAERHGIVYESHGFYRNRAFHVQTR